MRATYLNRFSVVSVLLLTVVFTIIPASAEDCLSTSAPEYADWELWGKPRCWCYERQCRGDADGRKSGPFYVSIPELNGIRNAFNRPDIVLQGVVDSLCFDFDHKKNGPFRVGIPDLIIFRRYFNKPELMVPPCNEEPIYTGPYNWWETP